MTTIYEDGLQGKQVNEGFFGNSVDVAVAASRVKYYNNMQMIYDEGFCRLHCFQVLSTGPSTKKKSILNIENDLLLKYFYVVREANTNDNELHYILAIFSSCSSRNIGHRKLSPGAECRI
jgi:hypothetical protein